GRVSMLKEVAAGRRLIVRQSESVASGPPAANVPPFFRDVTDSVSLPFKHQVTAVADFDREPLAPKLLSMEGPGMAVADVNGDGLDDIFIGGAKGQPGKLLIQQQDGSFVSSSQNEFAKDSVSDDVGAVFFDANG